MNDQLESNTTEQASQVSDVVIPSPAMVLRERALAALAAQRERQEARRLEAERQQAGENQRNRAASATISARAVKAVTGVAAEPDEATGRARVGDLDLVGWFEAREKEPHIALWATCTDCGESGQSYDAYDLATFGYLLEHPGIAEHRCRGKGQKQPPLTTDTRPWMIRAIEEYDRTERERVQAHYAEEAPKLRAVIRRILGIDVEVTTDEVLLDLYTLTRDGDGLRLMDHCPRCGLMVQSHTLIQSLYDMGKAVQQRFEPDWHHDRECPSHASATDRLVSALRELLGAEVS